MLMYKSLAVLVGLVGMSTLACGGLVNVNDTGGNGGGGESGSGGSGGNGGNGGSANGGASQGGAATGGGLPQGFCNDACAVTSQGGCLSTPDCELYCDAASTGWTAAEGEAFATCVAENPLCFESVEGCMLTQLHPPGSDNTARLKGTGFQEYNGKVLRVWHDPGTGVMFGGEQVISGGEFAFEWSEPFSVWDSGGPLLLLYIDMDNNGACYAGADITGTVNPVWNGDYLNPVYEATLMPPLNDPDFVCDFTP
ncbi:MAG: hypothetical protein IPK82_29240 [Polyangiaceae bacterium]|nr:hypothetical protein [Polyangiaceae bacterium]